MQKRILSLTLIVVILLTMCGCKKKSSDSESLVVLEDNSDIKLAIANSGNLNPLETVSANIQSIMNIVYEPLFELDEKMNAVPVLSESYKLSDDGRQITLRLRDDIKWHDGTNFTADDVIFTLSKLIHSNGLYQKTAKKISGFTATSNHEVVINLNSREPDFAYNLTFPILSRNTRYVNGLDFVPIGTGAYRFESKSENEIVFIPNSIWHGDYEPQKRVIIKILRDNSAVAEAFGVNETDAIIPEAGEQIANTGNPQTKQITSSNMVFLGFNTQKEKLSQEIRRAIMLMLDKQKILEKNAYGYGKVCDSSINPNSWAYVGADLEGTSQEYIATLLERSGYTLSDGVYENESGKMEFDLIVNSNNEKRMTIADTIAETLSSLGISVSVIKIDYSSYLSRINSGNFDMFVGEIETSSVINPLEMLDSNKNYFGFDVAELNELYSKLYGERDKEKYRETVGKIVRKFSENPPYVPLFFTTCEVFYGTNVSGITEPTLSQRYKNIGKWYFYNAVKKDEEND
ncbi:MAG: ABC transporter substrate-binding protein [Clostridia bacterium]|nr:ABC transporter substrate-binding protein [Clostridia bacterium]